MTAAPASDYGADRRMARGLLCSALLHALIWLLLVRAPWPSAPPRPPIRAIPIDLVELADETNRPAGERPAPIPQSRSRQTASQPDPRAVPVPERQPTADVDPLAAQLQRLARLHQPDPLLPPSPSLQDGAGRSNVTVGQGGAGRATYALKDVVRAQIERRWVLSPQALERNDWVVRLHLRFAADGRLMQTEILDDGRMQRDAAFRDFALSARNAALLSSPLQLPDGTPGGELVLDFNPRQVQQ